MPIQTLTSFIGVHCSLHLAVYHWWLFPNTISKIVREGLHPKRVRKSSALSFSGSLQPAASNCPEQYWQLFVCIRISPLVSLFIIEPGSRLYGDISPWCERLDSNQCRLDYQSSIPPTELRSQIATAPCLLPSFLERRTRQLG